jgi:hypothetical protein
MTVKRTGLILLAILLGLAPLEAQNPYLVGNTPVKGTCSATVTTNCVPLEDGLSRIATSGTTLPSNAPLGTIGASVIYSPNGALNVMAYGASGSATATTTVGVTTAPATAVTLTSAVTFAQGQGITVAGAGVAGALYIGTVTNVVGAVLTINPATSTTVAGGAAVNHDDLAAIHLAIAALPTNGGGVYFPPGWYRHVTPVLLHRSNVTFAGAGIGSSTVYNAGTGVGIDVAGGATYYNVIRDLSVIGTAASSHGLVGDSATEIILYNAEFSANGGYGVYLTNSYLARVLHCVILTNTAGGVYVGTGSNGVSIRDSHVAGNTQSGIQAQSFSDLVVTGNVLESQAYGLAAVAGSGLTFDGNYCEANTSSCVEVGSGGYTRGGSVRNNYVNCNGGLYGIDAYLNTTGVQISGNYFVAGCATADILFYSGTTTNYRNIVGPNSFAAAPVVVVSVADGNVLVSDHGAVSAPPGGTVPAWAKYSLVAIANGVNGCANANGCWQVNGVLGANKTAGFTQDVVLFALPAKGKVTDWSIQTVAACTGATTALSGLGTTGNNVLLHAQTYDIMAAPGATNLTEGPTASAGSGTSAGTNIVASLVTTIANVDQLITGCAVDYEVMWAVRP